MNLSTSNVDIPFVCSRQTSEDFLTSQTVLLAAKAPEMISVKTPGLMPAQAKAGPGRGLTSSGSAFRRLV